MKGAAEVCFDSSETRHACCNVRTTTTTTTGGSPARALGLASTPCHCQLGRRLVISRLISRQLRCVSFLCASCVLRFHTYARLCSVLACVVFFVRRLKEDAFSWHCVALHNVLCLLRVLLQPPPRLRQEWGGVSSCHRAATEMASTIIIITETAVVQGAEATPFITLHAIAIMVAAASSTTPAVVAAAASHRKRIGPLAAYRYVPYMPAYLHARV